MTPKGFVAAASKIYQEVEAETAGRSREL